MIGNGSSQNMKGERVASELIFNPIVGIEIFLVFFLSVSGPEILGQDKPNVSP